MIKKIFFNLYFASNKELAVSILSSVSFVKGFTRKIINVIRNHESLNIFCLHLRLFYLRINQRNNNIAQMYDYFEFFI